MKKGLGTVCCVICLAALPLLLGCQKGDGYMINDITIFKGTPVWELALAVRDQKLYDIEKVIRKDPTLLNFQEPHYGATLLLWSVGMDKYRSAEKLLELGADPNVASTYDGKTPLFVASGFSWVDRIANKDPKYVKLLLAYGADSSINFLGHSKVGIQNVIEPGTSPLMHSISRGIEKTKALVEVGADIDYRTDAGTTAAVIALMDQHNPEYAHYLIVEKKAIVSESYYAWLNMSGEARMLYPVDILRDWVFDIGSNEYKLKMDIVEEFARQGVDYWTTEIPRFTLNQIKKLYPDDWQEYIIQY